MSATASPLTSLVQLGLKPVSETRAEGRDAEGEAAMRLQVLAETAERLAGLPAEPHLAVAERLEQALLSLSVVQDETRAAHRSAEAEVARLESTLRALRAASRVAESVASAFERERVLTAIPDQLIRTFGAATARVWLVGPGDECASCAQVSRCPNTRHCLHLERRKRPLRSRFVARRLVRCLQPCSRAKYLRAHAGRTRRPWFCGQAPWPRKYLRDRAACRLAHFAGQCAPRSIVAIRARTLRWPPPRYGFAPSRCLPKLDARSC